MNTYVYVDGFNFYYRVVKGTKYKWLDLSALCRFLLRQHRILKIKYFTAHVSARPNDPGIPARQQLYVRALRTVPNLEIILGQFVQHPVQLPVVGTNPVRFATVLRTDEKGSDVNLASALLVDCYRSDCDIAVVVSNDSDLAFPMEHVKRHLGKIIGVVNPHKRPSRDLLALANFFKSIRRSALAESQFPIKLTDGSGEFHKPPTW